jgi:subtilase family serine protease
VTVITIVENKTEGKEIIEHSPFRVWISDGYLWNETLTDMNFSKSLMMILRALPDLTVTIVEVTSLPLSDAPTPFLLNISNHGTGTPNPVKIHVLLNGEVIGMDEVPSIVPGENVLLFIKVSLPSSALLKVMVDPEDEIDELNETNNEDSIMLESVRLASDASTDISFNNLLILTFVIALVLTRGELSHRRH